MSLSSDLDLSGLSYESALAVIREHGKAELCREDATVGGILGDSSMEQGGEEQSSQGSDVSPPPMDVDGDDDSDKENRPPEWVKPVARTKNFRLKGKNLFLTFPQCDCSKEDCMKAVKQLDDLEQCIVAHELHKDGSNHLHCFIKLSKMNCKRGYQWLDDLTGGCHGNYQLCRRPIDVVRYVTKGGDYISFGIDPKKYLEQVEKKASTGKVTDQFALMMKDNAELTIDDLDDINPAWVFRNKRKAEEYLLYQQTKRMKLVLLPWPTLSTDGLTGPTLRITKWLIKNIRQKRKFKQKQLYIYSPPNMGKTHLLECLSRYLAIYTIPKANHVDGYEDGRYDLAVMDEFKAHLTVQFLNEFLQGSVMSINRRFANTVKKQNIPIIFLSNFTLEECYHKKTEVELAALKCRFKIVELIEGIDERIDVPFPQLEAESDSQ